MATANSVSSSYLSVATEATERPAAGSMGWRSGENTPTLQAVLKDLSPLPQYTVFLGICEDGLPLLMNLSNPSAGSILVIGDQAFANKSLVRSLLASMIALIPPDQAQITLVSPGLAGCEVITRDESGFPTLGSRPEEVSDLIWKYTALTEERLYGHRHGPVKVLVIDGLESLILHLDQAGLEHLDWLVLHGPRCGVWVVASQDLERVKFFDDHLVHAFGTRLLGPIGSPQLATYLSGTQPEVLASLIPGVQFCVVMEEEVVKFWLPRLDGSQADDPLIRALAPSS